MSAATGSPVPMHSPASRCGHLSGDSGPGDSRPAHSGYAQRTMAGHGAPRVRPSWLSPPAHTQPQRTSSQSSLSRGTCWSRGLQEGQRGLGWPTEPRWPEGMPGIWPQAPPSRPPLVPPPTVRPCRAPGDTPAQGHSPNVSARTPLATGKSARPNRMPPLASSKWHSFRKETWLS